MSSAYSTENKETGVLPQIQGKRSFAINGHKEWDMPKVSAVIITLNEEAIIGETLSRLWWCDEIIIVDSGSTDRTIEICEAQGCSVFFRAFRGFGEQKNFGVTKAKNDWILCIDADEVLTEPLIDEIRTELDQPLLPFAAFSIPRKLVFMNKIFEHGKESGTSLIRLFNKTRGAWDGALVHERVCVSGPVKKLKNKILHYSYHSYTHYLHKTNLYSSLGSQKLLGKDKQKSRLLVTLAIPFNFFKSYFIDRNFLNGYRGFVWAAFSTFSHFLKYLKLEELKSGK